MRTKILQLLREHRGQYLSGEEISQRLGVSRTAIWKHMQALKQQGYKIESHSRLGYCLWEAPDRLLPLEIGARLTTKFIGQDIYYYDEVDSTNNTAKKLAAEGCAAGTIVVAESQNTGRGRLSRGWFSPSGKGIWLSVVLRPPFSPQDAPKCTLLTAVAVNEAIRNVAKLNSSIKWPNDILYQGKKLVGILTEMSAEMDSINYIVIGVGVNVNIERADFPPELADIATSLLIETGHKISRMELLIAILERLEHYYLLAINEGFAPVFAAWRSMSVTLGQQVDVFGFKRKFTGVALDIDDDGALLVQTAEGVERVLAGDVSIRPAKAGSGFDA